MAARVYPVPFTDTTLIITFGGPLRFELVGVFLDEMEVQVIADIGRYGGESLIPRGGYDRIKYQFDFSVYSPQDLPSQRGVTREILRDAIEGVGNLVVQDRRYNEVFFTIEAGSGHVFRGYGRLFF